MHKLIVREGTFSTNDSFITTSYRTLRHQRIVNQTNRALVIQKIEKFQLSCIFHLKRCKGAMVETWRLYSLFDFENISQN